MPMREVQLTEALERFIEGQVATGVYEDASDVIREALLALEREEKEYETKSGESCKPGCTRQASELAATASQVHRI